MSAEVTSKVSVVQPREIVHVHEIAQTDSVNSVRSTETELGFWAAVRLYPGAIFWSLYFSLGVIMLAFDPQLLGNLYAMPAFQRDFGYYYPGTGYIVSAPWQTGLGMGNPIGQVFGALLAAYPMDKFGRRKTFGACVVGTAGIVFIQFFARSPQVLLVGELLGGLILGTYCVIAPTYASEVCPVSLRGMLTAYTNLCFVIGQLIANAVTRGTQELTSHWAYSIPFAVQWIWPVVILIGLPFAPESPWWLQRVGRLEEAEHALARLSAPGVDIKAALAIIIETDRLEQEMETSSTYNACFSKSNALRTEIATGVYCIQVLSGIYLVGYATYFFELAGLNPTNAFNMGVGFLGVGVVGTVLSWVLLAYFGRRTIYNVGLACLAIIMLIIGILDCVPNYPTGVVWAQSALMVIWNFVYDLSIGPVCFVILCEVSAAKVRAKTIAFATAAQAVLGIVMTIAIPYAINPDQGNMRGKLGFLFGGLALLSFVWSYLRVPETRGRTYEMLDTMFEREVPLRKFDKYDAFSEIQ